MRGVYKNDLAWALRLDLRRINQICDLIPRLYSPTQDEDIHISVPLPECRYQVLTENKDGEPVKFATVGQTVYHQWTCEPEEGQSNILFKEKNLV